MLIDELIVAHVNVFDKIYDTIRISIIVSLECKTNYRNEIMVLKIYLR